MNSLEASFRFKRQEQENLIQEFGLSRSVSQNLAQNSASGGAKSPLRKLVPRREPVCVTVTKPSRKKTCLEHCGPHWVGRATPKEILFGVRIAILPTSYRDPKGSKYPGQPPKQLTQHSPQHLEFPQQSPQQSPQPFWRIPAWGSCSLLGESQC